MAIARTGSAQYSEQGTGNTGSFSISIPADAEFLVIAVTSYMSEVDWLSGGTVTLDGTALTSVGNHGDAQTSCFQGALWHYVVPAGIRGTSKTLAWDWVGTDSTSSYQLWLYAFYSGVDAAAPVRSDNGAQSSSGTVSTGTLTAQSGDKAVAFAWAYSDYSISSWTNATEILERTHTSGDDSAAWAEGDPSGDVDISCTISTDGGIIGLIIKPSTTAYEQEGYRFRNDDGSETGATWAATQDTGMTAATGTNKRLRMLVNATDNPASAPYQLQYKKSTDTDWKTVH